MSEEQKKQEDKMVILATQKIAVHPELYKIVDMCNRTLKDRRVMFGLTKTGPNEMTFKIYEI